MNAVDMRQRHTVIEQLKADVEGTIKTLIDQTNKAFSETHQVIADGRKYDREKLLQDITDEFTAAMTCVGALDKRLGQNEIDICAVGDRLHDHVYLNFWGRFRWLLLGHLPARSAPRGTPNESAATTASIAPKKD